MPIAPQPPRSGLRVADRVAGLAGALGPDCTQVLGPLIDAVIASATVFERASEVADRAEAERYKAAMVWDRRTDEVSALERMASALERFELIHGAAVVADELASLRGIELCRISVLAFDGRVLPVAAGASHGARRPPARADGAGGEPASIEARAMAQGDLVLWRRPPADDLVAVDGLHRLGLTSAFALPLWADDDRAHVVGAIMAGSTGGHRLVTDEHLVVADIAARLLVRAAGSTDALRQLGHQSTNSATSLALQGGEVR